MHKIAMGLAGLAALTVAVPASAATELFNETFEGTANNGFGQFVASGRTAVATGQAYKDVGFDGTDAGKLANRFAAFGGGNRPGDGLILSAAITGPAVSTLYTINFDAGYIGRVGANILDQNLLFIARDMFGNSVTADLRPAGNDDPDATGVLGGSDNVDTVFTRYQYQFTGQGPISLSFSAGGARGDNADVLIDNVLVRAGAVPEASTWAMMLIGFGAIGGAIRRRSARAPATA